MSKDLKRSLTLQGHRTSVSLEPEFWEALNSLANNEQKSVAQLVGEVDATRGDRNLSSALRVLVLQHLRDKDRIS